MKKKNSYNPYQSVTYQIESMKNRSRKALLQEYLIFLATLYGGSIQDGTKSIQDYKHLTMQEVRIEIQLRTKMLRNSTNAKIRKHVETEKRKQDEILRRLAGIK